MALIGKFLDLTTGQTFPKGQGTVGPTGDCYRTIQHSLGTTPDLVEAVVVSVGVHTHAPPRVIGVGGNASISTVMLVASTLAPGAAENNTVAFSVLSHSFYSLIR